MSYWTLPVFRRRGLATRAVVLVTRYAFDTLGVTEVELETEPDNVASRGVAQRAGFVDAGTIWASPGAGAAPRTTLRFVLRDVTFPLVARQLIDASEARAVRGILNAGQVMVRPATESFFKFEVPHRGIEPVRQPARTVLRYGST
jgi:hypothetical protein